jgi:hypothetical protein
VEHALGEFEKEEKTNNTAVLLQQFSFPPIAGSQKQTLKEKHNCQ